jgi:hypothetical protein
MGIKVRAAVGSRVDDASLAINECRRRRRD